MENNSSEREHLTRLRRMLVEYFSDSELHDLCFDLGVEYDNLPGEGKANKARELIAHCKRYKSISELVRLCIQYHPNLSWYDTSEQRVKDQLSSQTVPPKHLQQEQGDSETTIEFEDLKREIDDLERQVREHGFRADFERAIGVIRSILPTPNSSSLPSNDAVIEAALWLWDKYDEDARETVVQSLMWVKQSSGRELLREVFKSGESKERRLLRDPHLKDIAPEWSHHWYDWPPHEFESQSTEEPGILRWLNSSFA